MVFHIRRADQADLATLLDLRMAILREVGNIKNEEDAEQVRVANKTYYEAHLDNGDYISFIAESQGSVVGTIGLILIVRPPYLHNLSGVDAYISNVYTIPAFRGKGVATALLDRCIEYAQNNQVGRILLNASADGRSVYEKRGFKLRKSAMELVLNG